MAVNCLLFSLAGTPKILSDFVPDNGLAGLAGALAKNGHRVRILDYNQPSIFTDIIPEDAGRFLKSFARKVFLEEKKPNAMDFLRLKMVGKELDRQKSLLCEKLKENLLRFVEKERIDFVGIKLWAGEGFGWCLDIGRFLKKKRPGLKIFAGGPQVDIFGQLILKKGDFLDALCYGEGEETILALADFVQGKGKLEGIPNLIYRKDGTIAMNPRKYVDPLDSLALPIYDPEVYQGIAGKIKMFVLDESRGCPNSCYFCIHPVKSGTRRKKTGQRVVDEMRYCLQRYGVRLFRFAGSSTPSELLAEVAERLTRENLGVKYTSFGSIRDFLGEKDFAALKKSGLESIFFGVESANEDILKKGMNRPLKKTDMEKILLACKAGGIFTVVSIIHPAPFETEATRTETLQFLEQTRPDAVLVQFPGIYPGTAWFREPARFNFSLDQETYPEQVMNYQIKSLFPARYWQPLPYQVNGKPFREFASQTEEFQKGLNRMGFDTSVSDEAYLLWRHTDFPTLQEFVKYNRFLFYAGAAEELAGEIATINKRSA